MPTYKLKDLVTEVISGEWGEELTEGNEGTKIIRTTNFSNVGKVDLNKEVVSRDIPLEKVEKKRLLVGDTIIEKSGGSPDQPVGRVVFFEEEDIYLCNNFTSVLRPNKDLVVPKYFMYLMFNLHRTRKVMKFQNKTTGIINLKLEQYLNQTSVHLPNVEVQEKIAKVLDKTFDLITKRQSQITALDELTQSIFLEMFGDSIKNSKNLSSGYLSDYINYLTSGSRGWAKYYSNAGELFITIKNVRDGRLFLNDITYVNAPETKEAERTKVQEGDLLLSITADLGRTAVVDKATAEKGGYINQHLALIRLNEKINPTYLAHFMRSKSIEIQLEKMNQNGVKAGLNFDSIRKLKILIPAMSEQEKFVTNLNRIEKTKSKLEESLGEIENLYNSLLQKAFKGELF